LFPFQHQPCFSDECISPAQPEDGLLRSDAWADNIYFGLSTVSADGIQSFYHFQRSSKLYFASICHIDWPFKKNVNSNGVLAATSFGDARFRQISNNHIPSFSFITIETLEKYGNGFLSGVVANNGLIQTVEGRHIFEVSKVSLVFNGPLHYYLLSLFPHVYCVL